MSSKLHLLSYKGNPSPALTAWSSPSTEEEAVYPSPALAPLSSLHDGQGGGFNSGVAGIMTMSGGTSSAKRTAFCFFLSRVPPLLQLNAVAVVIRVVIGIFGLHIEEEAGKEEKEERKWNVDDGDDDDDEDEDDEYKDDDEDIIVAKEGAGESEGRRGGGEGCATLPIARSRRSHGRTGLGAGSGTADSGDRRIGFW